MIVLYSKRGLTTVLSEPTFRCVSSERKRPNRCRIQTLSARGCRLLPTDSPSKFSVTSEGDARRDDTAGGQATGLAPAVPYLPT